MAWYITPLRAHRLPLIGDPMRPAMLDDPTSWDPLVRSPIPIPMSRCPHIAITRVPYVFGAWRGRRHVGDDLCSHCWNGSQQQDSVGKAHCSYQGDAGEVHSHYLY